MFKIDNVIYRIWILKCKKDLWLRSNSRCLGTITLCFLKVRHLRQRSRRLPRGLPIWALKFNRTQTTSLPTACFDSIRKRIEGKVLQKLEREGPTINEPYWTATSKESTVYSLHKRKWSARLPRKRAMMMRMRRGSGSTDNSAISPPRSTTSMRLTPATAAAIKYFTVICNTPPSWRICCVDQQNTKTN